MPERAPGGLASHVLDILLGISAAAESGEPVRVSSRIEKPTPLSPDFDPAAATL